MFPGPEEQFTKNEKNRLAAELLKKELNFIYKHMDRAGITRD
jgi:hypothetical protein